MIRNKSQKGPEVPWKVAEKTERGIFEEGSGRVVLGKLGGFLRIWRAQEKKANLSGHLSRQTEGGKGRNQSWNSLPWHGFVG